MSSLSLNEQDMRMLRWAIEDGSMQAFLELKSSYVSMPVENGRVKTDQLIGTIYSETDIIDNLLSQLGY